ncbi:MAG: UMP kinase [Gammaproteobacteria bacterium GWE2_42_36]|nr:MAG: UMP kinase [Gammaproteobacteria bacterium GWE2_42_36]HCU05338.1 UMP kinase [Coxiellaceae bacterium]
MTTNQKPVFKRILLKVSGEALSGEGSSGVELKALSALIQPIAEIVHLGVEVGIVVGGGNFLRGASLTKTGIDRVTCDHMGMMATVMNGLVLRDVFLSQKTPAVLMSSLAIPSIAESYDRCRAIQYLETKHIVIFAGGTGNPLFSTDSAASLRGIEIKADIILKATKVDGVYSADPKKDKTAKRYHRLSYQEVLDKRLGVMDLTAICLCQAHEMPIRVFDMTPKGILKRIILGADDGTLVVS